MIGEILNENGWLIDGIKGSVNYIVVRIFDVIGLIGIWDINDWKVIY